MLQNFWRMLQNFWRMLKIHIIQTIKIFHYFCRNNSNIHVMKQSIATAAAPAAIGPYSQAIRTGDLLFLSGQLGIDPSTGDFVAGGVSEQTEQALKNAAAVLAAAGATFDQVVKTTVFLADMADFAAMNVVYERYFRPPFPARSAVAVRTLPKNGKIEIELIAAR
jgi:2-iminobutanoate/2-iminopropanoate deaminase